MSTSSYLVAEGVHDVAFIGKLLSVTHSAVRIRKLEDLDPSFRNWMASFTWPTQQRRGNNAYHDIERLAVPAPVFYRLPADNIVVLRNAKGINEIGKTLAVDLEAFARCKISHRALGIILDSDDEPAEKRFGEFKELLKKQTIPVPSKLGEVTTTAPRVGVITLPEPGKAGTLEDLLIALGSNAYPELYTASTDYVTAWKTKVDAEPRGGEWSELNKPSGLKKATISAMTALLKPGKSTPASIDDNRWLSEETKGLPCIQPCLGFLQDLLAE